MLIAEECSADLRIYVQQQNDYNLTIKFNV